MTPKEIYETAKKNTQCRISAYFSKELPQYEIVDICRISNHPDDWYIWRVMARIKNAGAYAVWTCWNDTTESLNFGHYGLNKETAEKVFYDIT